MPSPGSCRDRAAHGPADGITPGRINVPATHGWTVWGTAFGWPNDSTRLGALGSAANSCCVRLRDGQLHVSGAQNSNTIVQPVLQVGYNGSFGGGFWVIAWMCGPTCVHGLALTLTLATSSPAQSTLRIAALGFATGRSRFMTPQRRRRPRSPSQPGAIGSGETDDNYTNAVSGAIEIYNLHGGCTNLSGGQHLFGQLSFLDDFWDRVFISSWTIDRDTGVQPSACGYGGTSTGASDAFYFGRLSCPGP